MVLLEDGKVLISVEDGRASIEQMASSLCWWMSFKENEGEEGKKRGERFCNDLRAQHCCWSLDS